MTFLDWQLSRFGSPVLDLSYYFITSTTKEFRSQHYDHLIEIYYKSLNEIVRLCGSNAEQLFSWHDLQEQFKKFGKFGLVSAPMVLQTIVSDPENINSMESLADNLNSNSGSKDMATLNDRTERMFKERITDAIEHAIKYNWV